MNGHFPLGDVNPVKYFAGISVVLGLMFAMITPDQERHQGWVFLQWQLQTAIPIVLLILSHTQLQHRRWFSRLRGWQRVVVSGVIGSSLFVPLALAIDIFLMGETPQQGLMAELLDEWWGVFPPVTLAWVLMNSPWLLGLEYRRPNAPDKPVSEKSTPANPIDTADKDQTLLALAGLEAFEDILALSAELHYVDVISDSGHALVLYSLRQAVQEIPLHLGMQVHRSHWVAFRAIKALHKQGRQGQLTLHSGAVLPVSRNYLQAVAAALSEQP